MAQGLKPRCSDNTLDEVHASQAIIRQARQAVHSLDASKLNRAAPARIGGLADLDFLVVDALVDPGLRATCIDARVTIVAAPGAT